MRRRSTKTRSSLIRLLPALLALGGLSCSDRNPASPGRAQPPRQVREFLGERAVGILSAPTRVQTFRLASRQEGPDRPSAATAGQVQGFQVAAVGPERDAAFGSRVAAALFDPDSYQFNSAKGCKFDPGVALRVWKGQEHVDVLLCFACSEFMLYVPESDGKPRRAGEDFDNNRAAFVRLAKEAFPDDPVIRGL